jgi:hypothetical protein
VSDRDAFREAREAGLRARHETREARAVRKAVAEEIAVMLEERSGIHSTGLVRMALRDAAAEAREIGSRDPA